MDGWLDLHLRAQEQCLLKKLCNAKKGQTGQTGRSLLLVVKCWSMNYWIQNYWIWITAAKATESIHVYLKKFLHLNCIDVTHVTILSKLACNLIWLCDYKIAQMSKFSTNHWEVEDPMSNSKRTYLDLLFVSFHHSCCIGIIYCSSVQ